MKFIVDAQLPKSVSMLLNTLGEDSVHTLDLPEMNRTGDNTIIKIAETEKRVVITKDNDFLQSHCPYKQAFQIIIGEYGEYQKPSIVKSLHPKHKVVYTFIQK